MADPRRIAKVFGDRIPAAIEAGEANSQMTMASPFSPGTPVTPYDGFSRTPRSQNFVTGYNIATRPRTHERVSFDTLKGLIEAYDVAQMCIWHRIDSIRSLDWSLVAKNGFGGDVADAIDVGMAALAYPDRDQPFSAWLAAWLYDILAYDAGALYRMRNRRKDAIGLRVVDGTNIAPLLDYWGNTPKAVKPGDPEPEAYVQFANGLPWVWLKRSDLIYQPFRKLSSSPYGKAPMETILLNANTDLRFQQYFLQRFTDGNIPSAFASAPEEWSPEQIEQWQEYWDTAMYGDQAAKHQIRWMPGGSHIAWSNEKDFQDGFSLFLMRKTAAAYHIVPSDLGFTESVNRSSGESQADVQHRVGDLPLIRHITGILTSFLQDDLHLPLEFAFDLGEEQADRLEQAQADKIYMELGVIGASEIREERYGKPEPEGKPVPRFIFTPHAGPIPLSSLFSVAGEIDPATGAPEPGAPLPHTVFTGAEGVTPSPPAKGEPLAEQVYGLDAMPPAPPPQPVMQAGPVEKEGEGGAAIGVTSATGITGYDLVGQHDDEDDDEDQEQLAKAELAAFRKFTKARQKAGKWRDFEFRAIDPLRGRRLNQGGRLAVRKADGGVAVAGLAVRAADTGRVLMLQRCLDPEDPAGGCWEFPGGHLEGDESPLQGAWREWAEETGSIPPPGVKTGEWVSANGIYAGIVWTVDCESMVPVRGDRDVSNPDDPDGDCVEAIAWWDPTLLAGNTAVRPELLGDLDVVLGALGLQQEDVDAELAKASGKGEAPEEGASDEWPGWDADEDTARHWAAVLADALGAALTVETATQLASQFAGLYADADPSTLDQAEVTTTADDWLAGQQIGLDSQIAGVLPGMWTDGYLVGITSAQATATGDRTDRGGWQPGDTASADEVIDERQAREGLLPVLAGTAEAASGIADSRRRDLARELAKGLIAGLAVRKIGQAMVSALTSLDRALGVAITEITRSSGLAALFGYQQLGISQVRWALDPSSQTCPRCIGNAAAGPVRAGSAFPSGDSYPPVHPHCRCAVVPA